MGSCKLFEMYANDSCHFMAAKPWFTEHPLLHVSSTEDRNLLAVFEKAAKTRNDVTAMLYHSISICPRQTDLESLPPSFHTDILTVFLSSSSSASVQLLNHKSEDRPLTFRKWPKLPYQNTIYFYVGAFMLLLLHFYHGLIGSVYSCGDIATAP